MPVGPPLQSATELEVLGHVALHEGSGGPARVSGARFAHPLKHQSRSVTIAGQGRRARSSIWRRFAVGGPGRWRHAERVNCPGAASVIGAVTMCAPAAGRHAGPPGGHAPCQVGRDRPARARHRTLPAWEQDHRHGMSAGRNQSDEAAGKPGLTSAELPAPGMTNWSSTGRSSTPTASWSRSARSRRPPTRSSRSWGSMNRRGDCSRSGEVLSSPGRKGGPSRARNRAPSYAASTTA